MLKIYNAYNDMKLVNNNGTDYNKIKQQQLIDIWNKERTEAKKNELVSPKTNENKELSTKNSINYDNEAKQKQLMYLYDKENAYAKQTEAITGKISEVPLYMIEKNNRTEDIINNLYKNTYNTQEPTVVNKVR